jgi:hypothetical protein
LFEEQFERGIVPAQPFQELRVVLVDGGGVLFEPGRAVHVFLLNPESGTSLAARLSGDAG